MVDKKKHVLFIVENAVIPLDLRVWREALSLKKQEYEVSIISPVNSRYGKRYEIINDIEIYRHPRPYEANKKAGFMFEYFNAIFWEFYLSIKIFMKKPFHFIHSANPPDHIFLIAFLFKVLGVKFIFDHHDICPENYIVKFNRKDFFYYLLFFFEKLSFKISDIVISTNESYKKIAIERGKKKKETVFVVRNGPDLTSVDFVPPNKELKNGFKYLVVYIGIIGKQDGIENLLNIAKHIIYEKEVSTIKFLVVGTGPEWNYLVELSSSMGLERNVQFTGYIPYRQFYEAIASADICINPEYRNEFTDKSTMLKIMDYMTFRKPIIQFETTEGRVTAGEAAVYIKENNEVEFAETIIELLKDKIKRKKMGESGWLRLCQKLVWEKQQPNLIAAYKYLEN